MLFFKLKSRVSRDQANRERDKCEFHWSICLEPNSHVSANITTCAIGRCPFPLSPNWLERPKLIGFLESSQLKRQHPFQGSINKTRWCSGNEKCNEPRDSLQGNHKRLVYTGHSISHSLPIALASKPHGHKHPWIPSGSSSTGELPIYPRNRCESPNESKPKEYPLPHHSVVQ